MMSLKSRKMRIGNGFMCISKASTAVCMSNCEPAGSVFVPRNRSRRHQRSVSLDDTRLIDYAKYSKLVDSSTSSRFNSANHKYGSVSLPNINKRSQDQENESREIQKTPKDNVFQYLTAVRIEGSYLLSIKLLGVKIKRHKVVVMRVAIHCQGCAGKVKKHLAKMEGVTSFSIDVESKRVTVMGHISPVGVLESISKVKRAEFWNCQG